MNYIGSKHKLSPFIKQSVYDVVGTELSDKMFCDLFAGTGIVGRNFKPDVKQVISNDFEYYSYVLNRNYIGNHQAFDHKDLIDELNALDGTKGFVFEHYSATGSGQRQYFSAANGQRIDAVRQHIEAWKTKGEISEDPYYFLLASLLESADKVANTASVYGAYLKNIKKSAQKELRIEPALFSINGNAHKVYQTDSNNLIKRIEGDILYLDPPYNARQYGANYHLLNTIAKYKPFVPKGKTGLPSYQKSDYCRKKTVAQSFEELIKNARFRTIFLSYNNEGLMRVDEIEKIMAKYGRYDLLTKNYQRFRADKAANRNHKADSTQEYLHILEKD